MTRLLTFSILLFFAISANAHVSERALVLLLPTEIYIRSGVVAVALTIALLFLIPPRFFATFFGARRVASLPRFTFNNVISVISTIILFVFIYAGFQGSRDPLANPLPLLIWTLWWMLLPVLSAVFGNIWDALNPWSGLYRLLGFKAVLKAKPPLWAGPILLILFSLFVVSDVAPDDPDRLAFLTFGYWIFTASMMLLFGDIWRINCEPFTIFFRQISKLSPFYTHNNIHLETPGTRLTKTEAPLWLAALIIIALGSGSFDGFNETFFWLAQIGINPLEFPGRSAVALPNALGLLLGISLLGGIVFLCVWIGLKLVGETGYIGALFPRLTLSLIPIALGYHIAHYLTSFMVGIQYVLKAATDPMSSGQDLLGLGQFYVTTSFFNVPSTVETIWLIQAFAIVLGHIWAVLIAHAIALNALGDHKRATFSQLPMAAFMVAYTFFGLWILAQPTGA